MTREELIEELFYLRDYHTVSKKTCDYLKLDLLRSDYHYSAGNDSRVAELLEYISPTETDFPQYIDYTAFTIVANMPRFNTDLSNATVGWRSLSSKTRTVSHSHWMKM
ncbi:MAG: hypothetical protein LUF78_08880 [Clostridiales bacterium]|nr:hypothetical protein [Clostridiales bacterium]